MCGRSRPTRLASRLARMAAYAYAGTLSRLRGGAAHTQRAWRTRGATARSGRCCTHTRMRPRRYARRSRLRRSRRAHRRASALTTSARRAPSSTPASLRDAMVAASHRDAPRGRGLCKMILVGMPEPRACFVLSHPALYPFLIHAVSIEWPQAASTGPSPTPHCRPGPQPAFSSAPRTDPTTVVLCPAGRFSGTLQLLHEECAS